MTSYPHTTIEVLKEEPEDEMVCYEIPATTENVPETIPESLRNAEKDVQGLVYLEKYDKIRDVNDVPITMPVCGIDAKTPSVYMCMKCGTKQNTRIEIHRLKCSRCYNKAFNKIRPPKWQKFYAH